MWNQSEREPHVIRRFIFALLLALLAGVILATGACRDDSEPTGPGVPDPSSALQAAQATTGDPLGAYARRIPGFGGFFIDGSYQPTVYLKNPQQQRATAQQVLSGAMREFGFAPSQLRVLQGQYTYLQLAAWHRKAWPILFSRVRGAHLTDVDEASNRVRVGVLNATAAANVRSTLALLNIPSAAVIIEQRKPFRPLVTLRDRVRPVKGGLQINFFPLPVSPVTLVCTLGFNAIPLYNPGAGERSFITNSHCSEPEGGEQPLPAVYYQPVRDANNDELPDAANHIATEAYDPDWWTTPTGDDCSWIEPIPGPPVVLQCRYSDALRAKYLPNVRSSLGQISRLLFRTRFQGTEYPDGAQGLTIDPANPFFQITGERPYPTVGQILNKVGRTTGWTYGPVTETCFNSLAVGTTHVRLCNSAVNAGSAGGDSGSPVFAFAGGGKVVGKNVILQGILWGGGVTEGEEEAAEFVFSPMFGIEREIGLLRTF